MSSSGVQPNTSSVRMMSASDGCPPPLPPSPPTPAPLVGVRATLSIGLTIALVVSLLLIRANWRQLCRAPSTTQCCGESSKARTLLLGFRLACGVWHCAVTLGLLIRKANDHAECPDVTHPWFFSLFFYTVWNYLLQAVFWFTATAASAASLLHSAVAPRRLRTAVHLLLSICLPSAILVSVVLWGVLLPNDIRHGHPEREENFFSYNMHAVNTVCLLAEFFFNRLTMMPGAFGAFLAWVWLYAIFCWCQNAVTGFWPYFFLVLDTWAAVGWYLGLFALNAVAYLVARLFSRLKVRWTPSLAADQESSEGMLQAHDEERLR